MRYYVSMLFMFLFFASLGFFFAGQIGPGVALLLLALFFGGD